MNSLQTVPRANLADKKKTVHEIVPISSGQCAISEEKATARLQQARDTTKPSGTPQWSPIPHNASMVMAEVDGALGQE